MEANGNTSSSMEVNGNTLIPIEVNGYNVTFLSGFVLVVGNTSCLRGERSVNGKLKEGVAKRPTNALA